MKTPGQSQLGLNHGPGKGDSDRSPGWRKNYGDVQFGNAEREKFVGFVFRRNRWVKKY